VKKFSFLLAMLALALALGLTFVGCDNGGIKDALDGTTWEGKGFSYSSGPNDSTYTLTFNSPDWLMVREDGGNIVKGTYSVSGSNITFTTTNQWDVRGAQWNPATGSFLPKTGSFTDTQLTIVFTPGDSLAYTKK
jgi:hypothetical protein